MTGRQPRGITLLEVLIALAIVATALAAASRSVALSGSSVAEAKLRVMAGFVAENLMAELSVRRSVGGPGSTEGSSYQGGLKFVWRVEVVTTPNPGLRRVDIRVLTPDRPPRELRHLVGIVALEN